MGEFGLRQRLLGQGGDVLRGQPKHTDGAGDVFHRLLAEVGEGQRQLVAHLLVGVARDADAARVAQGLQSGGDVHAVAEDIAAVDDNVADVDADAKDDPPVHVDARVEREHRALDRHRAAYGIDDAGELNQQPVACGLDDPAVMAGDGGIDTLAPVRLQRIQRADLVRAHEPAVAGDVGRQNCRQPALDSRRCHHTPLGMDRCPDFPDQDSTSVAIGTAKVAPPPNAISQPV